MIELLKIEEDLYRDLNWLERQFIRFLNISGRIYHGKEWYNMHEDWVEQKKLEQKATNVSQIGKIRIYDDHSGC